MQMRTFLLLLPLATLSCVGLRHRPSPPVTGAGTFDQHMTVDGEDRTYRLVVPNSYQSSKPMPLILLLHGYTSNGRQVARYSRLEELAQTKGFILISPDGTGRVRGWNCGFTNLAGHSVDDIKFLSTLLDTVQGQLSVDPKRIFVCGHSNGGMLSYAVGSSLSDKVAAIGVVEGSAGQGSKIGGHTVPAPSTPVNAIIFHGLKDTVLPYDPASSNSRRAVFLGAMDSARVWAKGDGFKSDPVHAKFVDGSTDTWKGKVTVQLVTVDDGTHMWPGSNTPGASQAVDATTMMLDFFWSHPKS